MFRLCFLKILPIRSNLLKGWKTIKQNQSLGLCNQRAQTDGFAEQNGRDAERADLTCRY